MGALQLLLSSFILTVAISLDTMSGGFAFGTERVRVPLSHAIGINLISSLSLGISILLGNLTNNIIPTNIAKIASIVMLALIGTYKLINSARKTALASRNAEHTISWRATLVFAICVSIDGMAVGYGIAISGISLAFACLVISFSLVTDISMFLLGHYLGRAISRKYELNLAWFSGIIFIILASVKMLF